MSNEDEARDIAKAIMADGEMRSAQDYSERGRRFSKLSDDDLKKRWKAALGLWARDIRNQAHRTDYSDLNAEMFLRRIEPPTEEVEADVNLLCEQVCREVEDPETYKRCITDLKADWPDIFGFNKLKS